MTGRKKSKRRIISFIIFMIGFIACSYPLVSTLIEQRYQNDVIATYEKAVNVANDDYISEELVKARNYNSMLYQTEGITVGDIDAGILSDENYHNILNISNNGVMGSIEIPKIGVNLPIYHGTADEVLDVGIGHVKQSSLPVGGENTRTVLTGHRGLPNSKLFTRLDEMESGDLFFIRVMDEILAYKVCDIEIISPENVDALKIQAGRDMVTLLTCHPYGINSHRLIVTGERIEYEEEVYGSIESEMMSLRELLFVVIPFLFIGVGIVTMTRNGKRRR